MMLNRRTARQNGLYSVAIDLGEISPLRFAQYQQWHDVLITGPTRNVVGFASNDFPGLYYYDPRTQTEHVAMVSSPVDWRFCTLGRRVTEFPDKPGSYRLELGLFSERPIADGVQLKHTSHKRALFGPQAGDRDAMPDQWEALEMLAEESFKLLPLPAPARPYDWERAAATCLKTLSKTMFRRQRNNKKIWVFFETFVANQTTYKPEPDQEHEGSTELICQAGLCAALLDYAALKPRGKHAFQKLGMQLVATLPDFYDARTGIFQNTYPPRGAEWDRGVIDTWYVFHNLYQVLRAARLSKDAPLMMRALLAVERMMRFVKACEYEIPLFAKLGRADGGDPAEDGKVIGFALNPSVLGMYAALLVLASRADPEKAEDYRAEAVYALARLHRWPFSQMFHEPVQLSWAAAAAHALGETGWRDDFTRCLLLNCYRQGDIAGLFQGCAGLRYPAFRETVQAVEPWAQWLSDAPGELPLKQILAHVLSKAKAFLVAAPFTEGLPQEGLATLEQPEADKVGVAIYAAPQVFELARLQKQLGDLRQR